MIDVDGLVKVFQGTSGPVRAVDGISFTVEPGTIFGLLGPNGAGKTTTLRILATILRPTEGRVRVGEVDAVEQPGAVRARLGYISGSTGIYDRLTAREMVRYAGRLQGVAEEELEVRIEELFDLFEVGPYADRRCGELSTGNAQKVSLARALVHDPPVLVLDEPTAGLDILVARRVLELIERQRDAGRTVVLSTHVMAEVERLADRIGIIHRGRLLALGPQADLRETAGTDDLGDAFFRLVDAAEEEQEEQGEQGEQGEVGS